MMQTMWMYVVGEKSMINGFVVEHVIENDLELEL
jgi:hypothetical protein